MHETNKVSSVSENNFLSTEDGISRPLAAGSSVKPGVFVKTYGCQMNVYDSERMTEIMAGIGYRPVLTPQEAELVILNTCHIREKAAEKVYSDVGRIKRIKEAREDGGKAFYLAVAGCVAQAEGAEMISRAPVIDMVFGPQTYHRLPDMLEKAQRMRESGRSARVLDTEFPVDGKFDYLPTTQAGSGPAAFLTIQEGCDKFCTFCVVPYTRGAEFSRPVSAILDEAKRQADRGVRDITLLGQNVNAYHGSNERGGTAGLGDLIAAVAEIDGIERIRYTTSHPRDMDDTLIAAHRDIPECMPYLHLPVQSGSDRILAAMNRGHTAERYYEVIDQLRKARPDIALSSDFIVGFPGESENDFEATIKLVEDISYASAYSFKYSARPGTPASLEPDQLSEEEKSERLARLQALLNKQQLAFNNAMVGQETTVLLERPGKFEGQLIGRSPWLQAVHVDVKKSEKSLDEPNKLPYNLPGESMGIGSMARVKILEAGPNSLKGVLI